MGISTGEGTWSPLIWVLAALACLILAWAIWMRGRRTYKRGTDQELPFLSGERMERPQVGAYHLYWGFVEALRPYLQVLRAWHSGFLGDYVGWFLVMLAVVFLIVLV